MSVVDQAAREAVLYFGNDTKRIAHLLKVYSFAKLIGGLEGLSQTTQLTLELAALLHDVGIKNSEKKYGSSAGHYQQLEGPPVAREILSRLDVPQTQTERVCFLIAHHHTYDKVDHIDYRILIESDFLVNLEEGDIPLSTAPVVLQKNFRTQTGITLMQSMFAQ